MHSYSKARILDSIPGMIGRLRKSASLQSEEHIREAIDVFIEKVVWEDDHIREIKIYREYESFFPDRYKPCKRVSVEKLAEACHDPEISAKRLRLWNRKGVLPDDGRVYRKKRYKLKDSLRRIRITRGMMLKGYALWQIRDFLNGKPLLATVLPIAREMEMHVNTVRSRLRRCLKPALVRGGNEVHYYRLELAKRVLSQDTDNS